MDTGVVAIIVAIIGSSGLSALITALVNRLSKGDPVKIGLRLLLQDKIEFLCMKYISQGKITYAQLKFIKGAHNCYHSGLNGNGDLNDLIEKVHDLPVIYPIDENKKEIKS